MPVGVESGWHTHPGEEIGYILAGTIEVEVHGRDVVICGAGNGFVVTPAAPHNARSVGPGTARLLSTYIVEVGKPQSSPAP